MARGENWEYLGNLPFLQPPPHAESLSWLEEVVRTGKPKGRVSANLN